MKYLLIIKAFRLKEKRRERERHTIVTVTYNYVFCDMWLRVYLFIGIATGFMIFCGFCYPCILVTKLTRIPITWEVKNQTYTNLGVNKTSE